MTPTILPGDKGIVNKWKLGARIFNISKAINGEKVEVYRLPGYGRIERNDIVVFNYPLIGKDTVGMNMRKYYCKRIVAIPGESLEIFDCRYILRGSDRELGNVPNQEALNQLIKGVNSEMDYESINTWPYDSVLGWTIQRFGPLLIPKKGTKIKMTRENTILYGHYIAWEQQASVPEWHDGYAWIGDNVIEEYIFSENYYFTAGDCVDNSSDSRFWGFLPEPMIVGTTSILWDSKDPKNGSRRWNRILKHLR